ncbi:Ig-like domain-containing protein [Hydrogenophaga sp. YM1]|uniref:Ig-like domain-containing protein n=1 Tax=Hydrogenophaga sp. YM1 TaxID=2806262 RepID=UPI00195A6AB0|nr:Ig-like domain-containing protein [Hydrogenophaga sp. YM1]QRR35758.1 Ig-like domain-containing protein [Hydrogenophaga sp. YM1]
MRLVPRFVPWFARPLVQGLLQRPWRWLLLLLASPFAWAAGVSINHLTITNVQQLSFAQARLDVPVGAQVTQTATVRLSPGAVTYRSGDTAVAAVNAQTGQVSGVLSGETTIVATQAASPPYPAASASYTIRVKGQPIRFNPWQLASVAYGVPSFQIAPPTSNVQGATIVYSLKDKTTAVASITEQGLVTVKAVGKTTIVATQRPLGAYDGGTTEAELEVTAITGLNDREIAYTPVPIDLPPQLGGQPVTYSSGAPAVATVMGTSGQPQVSLKGLGQTQLKAANAAGTVIATATWTVIAAPSGLSLANVTLPSTAFETTLQASSNSPGAISYSLPSQDSPNIAELSPSGHLLVKGPGTVQVQVSQAASGPYAAASITASVTISDGRPGVVITSWPTQVLHANDTFEVRYRVNYFPGGVSGGVYSYSSSTGWRADSNVQRVSYTPPAAPGQEGVFVFKVVDHPLTGGYRFALTYVAGPFGDGLEWELDNPDVYRDIAIQYVNPHPLNLGPAWQMVYGDKPVMPPTYDDAGNPIPANDPRYCPYFMSSNPNVLRGVGVPFGSAAYDKDHWETTGVGQTTISCGKTGDYLSTTLTVIGADPRLQAFPAVTLGMDSNPYPLLPAASLNPSTDWRYEIVQTPGQPVVAKIQNGQVVPLAAGTATLRATQAASNNFREASIDATLTVTPAQARVFDNIVATFGDPDFDVPRPQGIPGNAPVSYQFPQAGQDVATLIGSKIHILHAGTTPIQAVVGGTTYTGTLTVNKAKPRLFFYFTPRLFFSSTCGQEWTWPIANQGTNNTVGGTLITNSDGPLFYPMGSEPGNIGNAGPNQFKPYYLRWIGHRAYTPEMAVWSDAWVEQGATRDFEAATSEKIQFSVWGNDRVIFANGQWILSCSQ